MAHVALVADHADELDPLRPAMTFCAYCHTTEDASGGRAAAACYGCHLSGHQPLDANGEAHFWPVADVQEGPVP